MGFLYYDGNPVDHLDSSYGAVGVRTFKSLEAHPICASKAKFILAIADAPTRILYYDGNPVDPGRLG